MKFQSRVVPGASLPGSVEFLLLDWVQYFLNFGDGRLPVVLWIVELEDLVMDIGILGPVFESVQFYQLKFVFLVSFEQNLELLLNFGWPLLDILISSIGGNKLWQKSFN